MWNIFVSKFTNNIKIEKVCEAFKAKLKEYLIYLSLCSLGDFKNYCSHHN